MKQFTDITFVGIAAHDTDAAMHAFLARHDLTDMMTVVDDAGDLWAHFGVRYQPAWVFLDTADGVTVVAGALFGDGLDRRLEQLRG